MWWNSANCLTTIATYHSTNPSNALFIDQARNIYETSFKGGLAVTQPGIGKQPGSWLNSLYDDEGWWALAWIEVYDVTGNKVYLGAAQDIYADMKTGLNRTSCGGLVWQRDTNLISSIENSLFLDIAAKLAMRVASGQGDYLSAAMTQYQWLTSQSSLVTNNLIPDGLNPADCTPNERLLTYNQGAMLGALVALHQANPKDESYLERAINIARATIDYFPKPNNGILTEDCDPNCDTTAAQFKGIFIRNLATLQQVRPQDDIRDFIHRNADSIWKHDRGDGNKLGSAWAGPYQAGPVSAMCSGLDGLVAAAMV